MRPVWTFIFLAMLLLGGCATMNQSECLNADWRVIGLEDGTRGRNLAYIGKHRQACAEYGISPDLNLYSQGHDQGVRQYCTYSTGFSLGEHGNAFRDICPPDLLENFRLAYQRGQEVYSLSREYNNLMRQYKDLLKLIEEDQHHIEHMEQRIISRKTSESERARLLAESHNLLAEIDQLDSEAAYLEDQLTRLNQQRQQLRSDYLRYQ